MHSPWEMLYDFLIEIFATMIPGIFFLSFFIFLSLILLPDKLLEHINNFARDLSLFMVLVFGSIAYCFGALFHRKEIKKIDRKSARHIYTKDPHGSGHSFAFANAITDNYIKRLVCILQVLALNEDGKKKVEIDDLDENGKIQKDKYGTTKRIDLAIAVLKISKADIKSVLRSHHLVHNLEQNKDLWQYAVDRLVYMIYEEPTENEMEKKFEELSNQFAQESSLKLREALENIIWNRMNEIYCVHKIPNSLSKVLQRWYLDRFLVKSNTELKKISMFRRLMKRDKNCYKIAERLHKDLTRIHASIESNDKNRQWKTGIEKIINYLHSDLDGTIDWPYTHMKRYCQDRGLEFADEVDWGDGAIKGLGLLDEIGLSTHINLSDEIKRSKSRINTQKMWISAQDSILYHAISKNEAHIRFMNAIRYAATPILVFAIITFLLSLGGILFESIPYLQGLWMQIPVELRKTLGIVNNEYKALTLALSIIYLSICGTIIRSIPEIMHYQRVRELTMMLKAQSIIKDRLKNVL
jgi:hypothetical protein